MKPTLISVSTISTIAASALFVTPLSAQQADPDFVPGANFLSNWDANEDGTVTLEELLERRNDVFSAFDENEDGQLSAEEYKLLDEARTGAMQRPAGRGNGTGRAEQALTFEATDANNDASVSVEEFEAASRNWLQIMDRDGDDVVSDSDFANGGQGQGNGQRMGQGYGQGQGQGQGNGQGRGPGQGRGQGWNQGDQPLMQGGGYGNRPQARSGGYGNQPGMQRHGGQPGMQRQGKGPGQMGRDDQFAGRGMGQRQRQPAIAFEGFTTEDGLWIVDGRTGDILLCRSVVDSNAPAGFVPVCLEAKIGN